MSQANVVVPPPVAPSPAAAHTAHISALKEKLAGTMRLTGIKNVNPADMPAATQVEAPVEAAPEAPAAEPTSEPTAETQNAAPAEDPGPAPAKLESSSSRLARSLEIQRRAEATAKRAREEARRVTDTRRQAEKAAKDAAELGKQVAADKERIDAVQREYQQKLRLLETDPLAFARQHGVDGAALAQFVKEGADPHARAVEILRREASAAITAVREEADAKYKALEGRILADKSAERTAKMQSTFFDYVEKAEAAQPEQLQALNVVYSRDELWEKANALAEKSDKLQLGWSPDRLLEEIETEAKADPRWQRIQARFSKRTESKPTPPKVPVKATPKSDDRAVDEVRADREPPPRRQDGTFQSRTMTPMERHKAHVERIIRGVRFQ